MFSVSSAHNLSPLLDETMYELFCGELKSQLKIVNEHLLALENESFSSSHVTALLRAVHSIKGAAKVVNLNDLVQFAHSMEEALIAIQNLSQKPSEDKVNLLFKASDLFQQLSSLSRQDFSSVLTQKKTEIESLAQTLRTTSNSVVVVPSTGSSFQMTSKEGVNQIEEISFEDVEEAPQTIKLNAETVNNLMALTSDLLVELPTLDSLKLRFQRDKLALNKMERYLDKLRQYLLEKGAPKGLQMIGNNLNRDFLSFTSEFENDISHYDQISQRFAHLTEQLYLNVSINRLLPFEDIVESFPRMIRDLSHQLGKSVQLDIQGKDVLVDREVLEKLIAPLSQLLRNAMDHGIETPIERSVAKKKQQGLIVITAYHRGGRLFISVSDDGRGADIAKIRAKALEKGYVTPQEGDHLTDEEWLQFMFRPQFSTAGKVSEISGRGVGLNSVKNTLAEFGGTITASNNPKSESGLLFVLNLPISLSVIAVLLTEISGESYGFPLAGIQEVLSVPSHSCKRKGENWFFEDLPLLFADAIFGKMVPHKINGDLSVICFSNQEKKIGFVVDQTGIAKEVAAIDMTRTYGKIPCIAAGAIVEDLHPLLIVDIESLVKLLQDTTPIDKKRKNILVVDDSRHVRYVLKDLLDRKGYCVKLAVNGLDAWNALCDHSFDLIISDVMMPRLDGLEFLSLIKENEGLKTIPVIIISGNDETEGESLKRGAVHFFRKSVLTKISFGEFIDQLLEGSPTI